MSAKGQRPSGFHAARTRQLRRAAFEGKFVWVGMRDGALELIGEQAGFLRIPVVEVGRLRAGFTESRYRAYRTILWLNGGGPPIYLYPYPQHHFHYAATVRDLAAAVAARGGVSRIEGGTSLGDALFGPLLMAVPALGAVLVAAFIVTDSSWWQRLAVPAIPVALLALLSWRAVTRHVPRHIERLDELDRQLPRI